MATVIQRTPATSMVALSVTFIIVARPHGKVSRPVKVSKPSRRVVLVIVWGSIRIPKLTR